MFASYLKIALRNLFKNKIYSLINIFGLAIGLSACLFIYQYAAFELSFDNFYDDADRIYRVSYQKYLGETETENIAKSPEALGPAFLAEVPEVELVGRLSPIGDVTVTIGESTKFSEQKGFRVDSSFVSMFLQSKIIGSLTGDGVLLSESTARKYFGEIDPVNQIISIYDGQDAAYKIRAVFRDLPQNTHFDFNLLILGHEKIENPSWQYTGYYTYVKLQRDADVSQFTRKMNAVALARAKNDFGVRIGLTPQPLKDIHLHSDLKEEIKANGNYTSLTFLILTGCFILIIAWLNYVNLSIVKSTERLKEIGVRKVIGSQRSDLVKQFLTESIIYNVISIIIAISIAETFRDDLNALSERRLLLSMVLYDQMFWMASATVILMGIVVTGVYPAWVYSGFKPINALKGFFNKSTGIGKSFRQVLIAFQFSITSFLIIGMIVIYSQMEYMKNGNLGMNIRQIVAVKSPNIQKESWSDELISYKIDSGYFSKVRTFSSGLSSNHSFNVASISHIPGKEVTWGTEGYSREVDPENFAALYMAGIDENFFPVFKIDFLAGRNFSLVNKGDQLNTVILNRAATKALGFETPESAVGTNMIYSNSRKEIIAVVEDYHQESFKHDIKPTYYQLLPRALDYFAISIPQGDMSKSLSVIRQQWKASFGDSPFQYFFLDDFFHSQYREDQRFQNVFNVFTTLSIVIACIGLFAMSSYLIIQRTKEIGIRKIMGASLVNIMALLSGFYLRLVFVATLIALPVSYLVMSRWLSTFAFRIDFLWWMLLAPMVVIPLITMMTISFQSVKSSLTNPLNSLKSE